MTITTRTPMNLCPLCGATFSGATSLIDPTAVPKPGDLSVCIDCGATLIFTQTLRVRLPRPGEVERAYAENPELSEAQRLTVEAVRSAPRRRARGTPH